MTNRLEIALRDGAFNPEDQLNNADSAFLFDTIRKRRLRWLMLRD
jgi:hypothetical protein